MNSPRRTVLPLALVLFALAAVSACDSPLSAPTAAGTSGLQPSFSHVAADVAMPSTNEANRTNGWAHVNVVSVDPGALTLEFVSTRAFASCFEYRVDGSGPTSPTNFNTDIHDGLWPFTCVNNSTALLTLRAAALVEVRMVFGAERDERFDWTPFHVPAKEDVATKEDCKNGGWEAFGFRNQGLCIRFVETGKDSR